MASTYEDDAIRNFENDLTAINLQCAGRKQEQLEAIIRLAIANNQEIDELVDTLEFYIVNDLKGNDNMVEAMSDVVYLRGGSVDDVATLLELITSYTVDGDDNEVENIMELIIGDDA
eukprot:jgi/Tetstr1/424009/TSEL_014620.t1